MNNGMYKTHGPAWGNERAPLFCSTDFIIDTIIGLEWQHLLSKVKLWPFFFCPFFFLMWIVFYYCQTSLNIAAPDRATGTMRGVGAFRQWSDIGTAPFDLRWSHALMRVTHASNFVFPISNVSTTAWSWPSSRPLAKHTEIRSFSI